MPWRDPPEADFEEYRWPFWNVDLEAEDLFGVLHKRFNTTQMFIQDPDAFHKDVCEMAYLASDQADFYNRLQERSDKRLEELKSALRVLDLLDSGGFYNLDDKQNFAFFRTRRFASLDCLIGFFASLLGPNHHGQLPSESRHYLKCTSTIHNQASGDADLQDPAAVTPMRTERAWPQEQQESEQGCRAKKRKRSRSATDGDSAGRDSNSQIKRKATEMNISNANKRRGMEKSEKPSHAYLNSKNFIRLESYPTKKPTNSGEKRL
ncbi:hypothetical protein EsDP_00006239 [Epichloe bromicola]|uniref:Uncharacterized protein n=1 Tax=Epichloe bromicola TaxID=79588 RepID=A0ABQ0CX08_9HYPO